MSNQCSGVEVKSGIEGKILNCFLSMLILFDPLWLTGTPAVRQLRFCTEAGRFPTVETAGSIKRCRWAAGMFEIFEMGLPGLTDRAAKARLCVCVCLRSLWWVRTVHGVSCMNKPPLRVRPLLRCCITSWITGEMKAGWGKTLSFSDTYWCLIYILVFKLI